MKLKNVISSILNKLPSSVCNSFLLLVVCMLVTSGNSLVHLAKKKKKKKKRIDLNLNLNIPPCCEGAFLQIHAAVACRGLSFSGAEGSI